MVADPALAIALDQLDVLVEATGALDFGARVMLDAVRAGRSVVSINAEVDATIGWLLHRTAVEHGGVYTICDGDQPGVLLRTLDHVRRMGFEPLVAVNCKRHLDIRQDPASSAPYAARDGTSPLVTTAAGDGTKMNVENAVVANLSGMPPDCRGMHGVPTTLERALPDVLGAISTTHVVEYTLGGDFGAGVFVIGRPPDPAFVQRALRFFKMGDGPDYLFFRPYTMVHFEMPLSIAEVVLDRAPLWSPAQPPVADVIAVAKHDLAAGVDLDGIGGYHCYGQIDTISGASGMLPIALAEHARLTRAVNADDPIPLDAVDLDDSATDRPAARATRRSADRPHERELMRFDPTSIPGVFVVGLELLEDERGFFARSFCADEFAELGLDPSFVQCNISWNRRAGTVRGMHYQAPPAAESKLVRCTRGADLRRGRRSATRLAGLPDPCRRRVDGRQPRRALHPGRRGGARLSDPGRRHRGLVPDGRALHPVRSPRCAFRRPRARHPLAAGGHVDQHEGHRVAAARVSRRVQSRHRNVSSSWFVASR